MLFRSVDYVVEIQDIEGNIANVTVNGIPFEVEMKLRYFEGSVTFVQQVKFTQPNYQIDAYLEYGACTDQNGMPPSRKPKRPMHWPLKPSEYVI